MKAHSILSALAAAGIGVACTPELNWRDVRPDASGLAVLMPCKPAGHARRLALAGVAVEMSLFACSAGGATYAIGFADIGQPQRVGQAVAELAAAAARNVGSQVTPVVNALRISGMTPLPQAVLQALSGRLPDGQRVEEQVAVFARGTRVYQATVVGPRLDAEATASFFDSLRLLP